MSLNDNNDRISMMSNIPNVMLRNGQMLDIKYNWGLIFRIWEYIISQKKKKKKIQHPIINHNHKSLKRAFIVYLSN